MNEELKKLSMEISSIILKINMGVDDGKFAIELLDAKHGLYESKKIINSVIEKDIEE